MVYSVAIDARAIEECQSLGVAGIGIVAALLNSLDQNCLLIECRRSHFSCDSLINSVDLLADSLGNEGADFTARNRLKARLKKMRITNRIKSIRAEESTGSPSSLNDAMASFMANIVDQVIVTSACEQVNKAVTLPRYAISQFEWIRSRACSEGINKRQRECHVTELLNNAFRTLLSWSDQVYLIDYSLGANWFVKNNERNTNYADAIPHWCSFFRSLEREMQVVVRTSVPREYRGHNCGNLGAEIELEFMRRLEGSGIQVKVEISDKVHSRFLHSCGFFIDIDRGFDICFQNGLVRKTSFGFKYDEELENQLRR